MSEIKGQILGVVLVLAIFGAIGTVLVSSFTQSAKDITGQMNNTDSSQALIDKSKEQTSNSDSSGTNEGQKSLTNNDLFNDAELLTF